MSLPKVQTDKSGCFDPQFAAMASSFYGQIDRKAKDKSPVNYAYSAGDLALVLDRYGGCGKDPVRLSEAAYLYREALGVIQTLSPELKDLIQEKLYRSKLADLAENGVKPLE